MRDAAALTRRISLPSETMTQPQDTDLKPPAAPELYEPREEAVVDGSKVTFHWEQVSEAAAYRLEVAADHTFDAVLFEKTLDGEETSFTAADTFTQDEDTYFWRVIAINDAGESHGEVIESFISGTPEDAAQHYLRPDRVERLGPLAEAAHEGALEAKPGYRGWEHEAHEELARPREKEDLGPAAEVVKAATVEAAAEATGAEEFYEAEEQLGVQHEGIGAAAILGFMLAVVVVIAMAVVFVFYITEIVAQETQSRTVARLNYPELREVDAQGTQKITQYEVLDAEQGVYRIPVERAMHLMVDEAATNPAGEYSNELQLQPGN